MEASLAGRAAMAGDKARPARVRTCPAPLRLTRRGRIVVTAAVLVLIGALSIALAGAAQAVRPRQAGTAAAGTAAAGTAAAGTAAAGAAAGAGKYVTKITVAPGQSLWSIAAADDPQADTRLIVQDILEMNSLTGDQVQPGQVIWVPRA
jgi:LysM repeat protein